MHEKKVKSTKAFNISCRRAHRILGTRKDFLVASVTESGQGNGNESERFHLAKLRKGKGTDDPLKN